jgi:single-stranded-DNA-specific exonuclease
LTKTIKDSGYAKKLGETEDHLRLFVRQKDSESFAAIGFGLGKKMDIVAHQKTFEAVYSIDENEFNGKITTQLRLKDIRN